MKALLVSGYAGEPITDERGRVVGRKPLTPAQVAVAEPAIMEALTWLDEGVLKHGGAPGIDTLADALARIHGLAGAIVPMPAPWQRLGRRAGMERNGVMVRALYDLKWCGYECRVLCLPGPKSRGTRHMERIAREAGFDVTVTELP